MNSEDTVAALLALAGLHGHEAVSSGEFDAAREALLTAHQQGQTRQGGPDAPLPQRAMSAEATASIGGLPGVVPPPPPGAPRN